MSKPIPPLDLMWLLMESQASPTHVGALLLFEKPKRRPNCVREIVTAYRSYAPTPPFNYIPELRRTRMPRFQEARTYDPQSHNQHIALPAASTYADLLRLVADLHESMLDRDRPLFRNWIIDCVPDDRFALYVKVHHAIVDGVSGTKRLYSSLGANDRHAILRPAFAAELPFEGFFRGGVQVGETIPALVVVTDEFFLAARAFLDKIVFFLHPG